MIDLAQLPALDATYPVTDGQIAGYRANGHVATPGVLSPEEVAAYRPHVVEEVRVQQARLNASERSLGGSSRTFAFSLRDASEAMRHLLLAPRLGQIAASLLGVRAVRILHYYGFFKAAGGAGTPWHQDSLFLPLDRDIVTIWLPLVDISADAAMTFVNGSHTSGFHNLMTRQDPVPQIAQQHGFQYEYGSAMRAGDADYHSGMVIHCAPPNRMAYTREALAIGFFPDGALITDPKDALQLPGGQGAVTYRQHLRDQYFPGVAVGDPAVGEYNPVVYAAPQ